MNSYLIDKMRQGNQVNRYTHSQFPRDGYEIAFDYYIDVE